MTEEFHSQSAQFREQLVRQAAGIREIIEYLERAKADAEREPATRRPTLVVKGQPMHPGDKEALMRELREISTRQGWNADEFGAIAAPINNASTQRELDAAREYMKDCAQCHETFLSAKKPIDEGFRNGTISPNDARTRVDQLTRELWACRAAAFEKYKRARR